MTFNEANTVEAFIRDLLCGGVTHHITTEGVTTTGGSMSHDGLDVGSSHKHTKVMPGGGISGVPTPKA